MIKIKKSKKEILIYKDRVAELYVCNFNGKILYKYVDKTDEKIRSKMSTTKNAAINDIRYKYQISFAEK